MSDVSAGVTFPPMASGGRETEQYESYEGFLKAAIRTYWEGGAKSKVNFLALLFAAKETWVVAFDKVASPEAGKKLLTGAAGAAALALLLRVVVGGPIGILLTGASVASLVAIYVKNHGRIWLKVEHYKLVIGEYRGAWEQIRSDWAEDGLTDSQRDLMVDGLLARLLIELDAYEPNDESDDEVQEKGFAAHTAKKRAEEDRQAAMEKAPNGKDGNAKED